MKYIVSEVNEVLFELIQSTVFFTDDEKPDGGLYYNERPLNSSSEDTVILGLPINNEVIQRSVINVNIYCRNVNFDDNEANDEIPDSLRLSRLVKLFRTAFEADADFDKEVWNSEGTYSFKIQQISDAQKDKNKQHFVNIRIEFYSINI